MNTLLESVSSAFGTVLDWIGTFLTSLTTTEGELNALLPLVAISVAVSVLMLGIVRQVRHLKDAGVHNLDLTVNSTTGDGSSDLRYASIFV